MSSSGEFILNDDEIIEEVSGIINIHLAEINQ